MEDKNNNANSHNIFYKEKKKPFTNMIINKINKKKPVDNNDNIFNQINMHKSVDNNDINNMKNNDNIFNQIKPLEPLDNNNPNNNLNDNIFQKNSNMNIQIAPQILKNSFSIFNNDNIMINNSNNLNKIEHSNIISFLGNDKNNNQINLNDSKREEEIKKDEEFAMKMMQEELKNFESNQLIERKKKEEEEAKKSELEIKRILEEDIKQIEENEKLERRRKLEDEQRRRQEEHNRKIEEMKRKLEDEQRRRLEEYNRKIEEMNRQLENERRRRQEEYNRRIEEIRRQLEDNRRRLNEELRIRYDIGDYNNNYDNLIESKININKLNEENKTCVICYEDFKDNEDAIFLPCFHFFHTECIKEWLKKRDICPLCKISVKNNLNN